MKLLQRQLNDDKKRNVRLSMIILWIYNIIFLSTSTVYMWLPSNSIALERPYFFGYGTSSIFLLISLVLIPWGILVLLPLNHHSVSTKISLAGCVICNIALCILLNSLRETSVNRQLDKIERLIQYTDEAKSDYIKAKTDNLPESEIQNEYRHYLWWEKRVKTEIEYLDVTGKSFFDNYNELNYSQLKLSKLNYEQ